MGLFSLSLDPESRAALDRNTQTMALLTTAIGRITLAMTALKDSADALVSEVRTGISVINDLVTRLLAALAANNQEEIDAVTAELTQATEELKAAIDAVPKA